MSITEGERGWGLAVGGRAKVKVVWNLSSPQKVVLQSFKKRIPEEAGRQSPWPRLLGPPGMLCAHSTAETPSV